jgi:hypothetical protein
MPPIPPIPPGIPPPGIPPLSSSSFFDGLSTTTASVVSIKAGNRCSIFKCGSGYFGRIDHTGFDQVFVLFTSCVVSESTFSFKHFLNNDGTFNTGIVRNSTKRSFKCSLSRCRNQPASLFSAFSLSNTFSVRRNATPPPGRFLLQQLHVLRAVHLQHGLSSLSFQLQKQHRCREPQHRRSAWPDAPGASHGRNRMWCVSICVLIWLTRL